jgi:hypothetical protein
MAPVLSFNLGDGGNVTRTESMGSGGKQDQQRDGDEQQVLCRTSHVAECTGGGVRERKRGTAVVRCCSGHSCRQLLTLGVWLRHTTPR